MTVGKRDAIKAQRTRKKRQQRMNTLLWVGGFIVVLILLLATPAIYNNLKPAGAFVQITPQSFPLENGKAVGDPNAPVKIEVYEDFQCPSCKEYTNTIEAQLLQSSYITDGQVYYEFMHYPFIDANQLTKESQQTANASMCALEQDRFWDYHKILYVNQGVVENGGSFNDKRLRAFAESLNLDMNAFDQCFSENRYSAEIASEFEAGQAAGVTGTPTVIVNGTILTPGFVPSYDQISSTIDTALSGAGG